MDSNSRAPEEVSDARGDARSACCVCRASCAAQGDAFAEDDGGGLAIPRCVEERIAERLWQRWGNLDNPHPDGLIGPRQTDRVEDRLPLGRGYRRLACRDGRGNGPLVLLTLHLFGFC